jgi:hypothetical protein
MQDEKPKRTKQSEKFIPEYDFLFEEQPTRKGKKEKNFSQNS